jgi:hypothetical protein
MAIAFPLVSYIPYLTYLGWKKNIKEWIESQ